MAYALVKSRTPASRPAVCAAVVLASLGLSARVSSAADAGDPAGGVVVVLAEPGTSAAELDTLGAALGRRFGARVERVELVRHGLRDADAARACVAKPSCRTPLLPTGIEPTTALLVVVERSGSAVRLDAFRAGDGEPRGSVFARSIDTVEGALAPGGSGAPVRLVLSAPPAAEIAVNGFPLAGIADDEGTVALPPLRAGPYAITASAGEASSTGVALLADDGAVFADVALSGRDGPRRSVPILWIGLGAGAVAVLAAVGTVIGIVASRVPPPPLSDLGDFEIFR